MRFFIILIFILSLGKICPAQVNYDSGLIPKSLLPYASAVVRNKDVTIQVLNLENTIYRVKNTITILNKNGDDKARISIWHNKSNQIKYVKGLIYDEYGKQIEKFSENSFRDENAANDFSLFEDSRVKYFAPAVITYPYTIEYEYEVRSKQSLNFDSWEPANKSGVAVEKSSFTFICKPDFQIRYKETNLPNSAAITNNTEGLKSYSWYINNLKAFRDEPYSPDPDTYQSSVRIAPQNFAYEGIKGSFTNWEELGKWVYDKLLVNRNQLPPETIAHIKDITKDITDPKQKARKIYEYVQHKTRYISVQIGIGGYRPFTAAEVDKLGYGDCKALVNYTQALLKTAGIESYYCQVQAGNLKKGMLPDFASMDQGNHVILCIPFKNDTTWLECTNQKIPFGFLGTFTGNRTVLACTAEGGKLLHTPYYTSENNTQIRKAQFIINTAGELSGNMQTWFKGTQYDNREELIGESVVEQEKNLKNIYPVNNFEIKEFSFTQNKDQDPVTTESIKLFARDYASVNNDKIFFLVNPLNRQVSIPRDIRNRLNDVYINYGYMDEDEITYKLPTGYRLEKNPLNTSIIKPFGTYTAKMNVKDGMLTYNRKLQIIDGNYTKDTYQALIDFYQEVVDADNYNVMLVNTLN